MFMNSVGSIVVFVLTVATLKCITSSAFSTHHHWRRAKHTTITGIRRPPSSSTILLYNSKGSQKTPSADQDERDMNPVAKASWYAVEAFGKLFSSPVLDKAQQESVSIDTSLPPKSIKETLERIRLDNDRQYFLSGQVDELIYDDDCVFSDPFVSFRGRTRFVENLRNLGSFITKYDSKVLQYNVVEEGQFVVETKLMVKLELNLPWKPILAWPWGVRYDISNDTFLITNHKESWDIDPLEGVKQIFRKPTTQIK